jgi:hypothetical protein
MRLPLRIKSVGTKVSEAEFAVLEKRARAAGLTLSEWVRDVLLASPVEPGAEAGNEVVLAELLALPVALSESELPGGEGRGVERGRVARPN